MAIDGVSRPHVLVGQSPACDLELTDPCVSRRHCAVDAAERVRITDLGSTNGTSINGVALGLAYLSGGETICIGDSELVLYAATEADEICTASPSKSFGGRRGVKAPQMSALYPRLSQLARSEVAVLIEGETGTGKEVLAEALHAASPRAKGPFVVFDCTAVPSSLFEAELFGHDRGAFTGANAARRGLFEAAHGGTLLIDEIGDLDLALQARLLRALDQHKVRRVGGQRLDRSGCPRARVDAARSGPHGPGGSLPR